MITRAITAIIIIKTIANESKTGALNPRSLDKMDTMMKIFSTARWDRR